MRVRKKSDIYFCDFETTTPNSTTYKADSNLTSIFLFYLEEQFLKNSQLGYSIEEFFNWVKEDQKSKLIYFHFLSFDGNFLVKHLLKSKLIFLNDIVNYDSMKAKNKPWNSFEFFSNGNKIYSITIRYRTNKRKWTINFKCSYNLLSSTINDLGKDFKMEKHNHGFSNAEEFYNLGGRDMSPEIKNKFITYIKSDVRIMRLAYNEFETNIYNNKWSNNEKYGTTLNLDNILTIGSLTYRMSRNYLEDMILNDDNKNINWKAIKKGYRIDEDSYNIAEKFKVGGWTQFSPEHHNKGFNIKKGIGIDINSSYPFQATKLLPYGDLYDYKIEKDNTFEVLEYYEIDVESAIIKEKYQNFRILKNWNKLNTLSNFRYCEKLFDFKCYYFKDEWEIIKQVYDIKVKNIQIYYSKAQKYFKPFIDEIYHLKTINKQQNRNATSHTWKISLNSFYGRQCMRKSYNSKAYIDTEYYTFLKTNKIKEIRLGEDLYTIETFTRQEIGNYQVIEISKELKKNRKYPNVLIGSTIASYGRVQLWSAILKIGAHKFLYGDTDSAFFNASKEDIIKNKHIELDEWKLGAWGIDFEFTKGKILGAKRYIFMDDNDKIKLGYAGVSKKNIDLDQWENYFESDSIINDAILRRKEDENGIYFERADYKIKVGKN